MRYQDLQPDNIASVDPGMTMGTVIYTLLLGIFFVVFGMKVRKRWITFWGATMVLAGGAYIVAQVVMPVSV
jgi:hypothetical protein